MLFKLRNRMMPTSENFGLNRTCKICDIEQDTTNHVFSCVFIQSEVPEVLGLEGNDTIEAIYGNNINKSIIILKIFEKVWRKREELLEKIQV